MATLHDAVWGRPGRFGLARCGCGHAFLSPRPPRESIGFYYKELYGNEGLRFEESFQRGWVASSLNRLRLADLYHRRRPGPGERHLDVGCGVGGLLARVARTTGATAVGVDMDREAIESARRYLGGLPAEVHCSTLAQAPLAKGSFATVSMIHFLEHSYEPREELSCAFQLLAPGGGIVVEVPGFHSLARRVYGPWWLPYLSPQHVSHFSRESLKTALEQAGFSEVRVGDCFVPLIWLMSFVLWWHEHLGGRSPYSRAIWARTLSLVASIVLILPLLVFDLVLATVVPRIGHGDHIRATGVRR